MLDPKIKGYLNCRRADHLEELMTLLRFPSISAQSAHKKDCDACAAWLADRLGDLGLDAEVDTTSARPIVLAASDPDPAKPTLLIYGHYDVQPPDPLELWHSPPFEPSIREGDIVARGASDDKGPTFAWIKAVEAFRQVYGELPVNVKFFIEGEEEVGSPTLEPFVAANRDRLACDYIAISDTGFHADGVPSITYALRGLMYVEVTLTGPNRDLHSGLYGGLVVNPLSALARLVADLHDERGRVTVPGFYDDVVPLTDVERDAWADLGYDEVEMKTDLGVSALGGERDHTPLERNWARPTLDCNGLWGGYTGQGPKTVIPSQAHAKISARLVARQNPADIVDKITRHLQDRAPAGTRVTVEPLSADAPWMMPFDDPSLAIAQQAMTDAFDAPCALIRCGASVPVTGLFQRLLGVDPLMMGFALPDDRVHSPNEKFRLDHYYRGITAAATLMAALGKESRTK